MTTGFIGMQSIWGVYGYTCGGNSLGFDFDATPAEVRANFTAYLKRSALIFDKVYVDEQEFDTLLGLGIEDLTMLKETGFFEFFSWNDLIDSSTEVVDGKHFTTEVYHSLEGYSFVSFGRYFFYKLLPGYVSCINRVRYGGGDKFYNWDCEPMEHIDRLFSKLKNQGLPDLVTQYFSIGEKLHDYLFTGHAMLFSAKNDCSVTPIVTSLESSDLYSDAYVEFIESKK